MRRVLFVISLVTLLLAVSGCAHGPGRWWDGLHYPYSCPRCPHYDYAHGHWKPFRFGVLTGPDVVDASHEYADGNGFTETPPGGNVSSPTSSESEIEM